MFAEDSMFVAFDDTEEDLTEALRRIGILTHIEQIEDLNQREAALHQAIRALRNTLNELRDKPVNQPEGEVSKIIKDKHFSFWKTIFIVLETGVRL